MKIPGTAKQAVQKITGTSPSSKGGIRLFYFASSQAIGASDLSCANLVFPIDGFGQTGLVAVGGFVYVGCNGAATID